MAQPNPREVESRLQLKIDAEMRGILEFTAKRLAARIRRMGSSFSKDIRKAQLDLILKQLDAMLDGTFTGPVTDTLMRQSKAAAEAAEELAETLTAPLYGTLPPALADALTDGLRASADSAIRNAFARTPRALSSRVWSSAKLADGWMHALIQSGLASGLTAREMAAEVYEFASPSTPGGASYAAMRLARTEINNAFHNRQRDAGNRPGVKAIRWNLSGSHRVPDECNLYAERDSYQQGPGVFPVGKVPDKPHPQCFCYLTYITMTSDELLDAMASGDLADELDKRTKANLARVGGKAVNTGSNASTLKFGQIDATADIQKIIRDNEKGASRVVARRFGLSTNDAVSVTVKVRAGGRGVITPGPNADANAKFDERNKPDIKRPTKKVTPGSTTKKATPTKRAPSPAPVPGGDTLAKVGELYNATDEIVDLLVTNRASAPGVLRLRYGLTLAEATNAVQAVMGGRPGFITPKKINLALLKPKRRATPAEDIKRIHKEGNAQVIAELKRQFERLPRTMAELRRVLIVDPKEDNKEADIFKRDTSSSTLAAYWPNQKIIRLHSKIFDSGANRRHKQMQDNKWFSQCGHSGHAENTLAHECGHHIARVMERDSAGFASVANAIAKVLGVEPPRTPLPGYQYEKALDAWVKQHKRVITSTVSRYGSSSYQELLAEIWAEYSTNPKARRMATKVGPMIQAIAESKAD